MVTPTINYASENKTKIIRECYLRSVLLSNTVKEEWYARITKLRKMVDQLFCKKFGEHRIILFFYGFVFLEGCFHYFLRMSTWMTPLIIIFLKKKTKNWQLTEKQKHLLFIQVTFIVKERYINLKCIALLIAFKSLLFFGCCFCFPPLMVNKTTIYFFISIALP